MRREFMASGLQPGREAAQFAQFGRAHLHLLGCALQLGEPGFDLFLDVTNVGLHLFHTAVEILTLLVRWRGCSVRGGLLRLDDLLWVAGCRLDSSYEQQENFRARKRRVGEVPHGFHPRSWITPRKIGNSTLTTKMRDRGYFTIPGARRLDAAGSGVRHH